MEAKILKVTESIYLHVDNKGLLNDDLRKLPFDNSISPFNESDYPGDWEIEEKISITSDGMP